MSLLVAIALTFALVSVLSIGGANATIPEIHRQVVSIHHWMDDATFVKIVAIGQIAPGPNVLVVSAIGWQLAGALGLLVATLSIVLPSSLLALGLGRVMTRYGAVKEIDLARKGLSPIALGFMLASGYVMTRAAYLGGITLAIVAGVAWLVLATRVSPIWGIAAGIVTGVAAHRLHLLG